MAMEMGALNQILLAALERKLQSQVVVVATFFQVTSMSDHCVTVSVS